jgi:cytochrome oxidase Cu insertion factor (SCO1/SenC/PrrC family)
MPSIVRMIARALAAAAALLAAAAGPTGGARAAATGDAAWGANYFPNVALQDQDGRTVRFFDDLVKGKVVAINFIFTGCSASCSMETARLRAVQELIGERMGKDVFFVSVSIDPDNDTPEALKAYAEKFDVAPGWTFVTGRAQDITLLRRKLGLYMPPLAKGAPQPDHDLTLIIGNQATGRWMKASPYENPQILATQLGSWLHNWKVRPERAEASYADAPTRLERPSRGEELYRTRCASCHTLGQPAGRSARRPIGPDLANVTRTRERHWLARWIREPDVMLAEKDPIATALYLQYNKLAMPNVRLTKTEVEQLLGFLEEVDAALAATAGK